MKRKLLFFLITIIFVIPIAFAADITMTINQSEYYFLVGQQAVIPIEINNTYGKIIDGVFRYTTTQQVNQQGFHYSSTNSQSQPFTVQDGRQTVNTAFGSSDQPMDLNIGLQFSYTEKEQKVVNLGDIIIHFVNDPNQQKNQQNQQNAKSQEVKNQAQQQSQSQSQQQSIQQQLQNMFNQNQQEQQQPSAQDRVQNNQLAQDSSALKQGLQKQMQQQQQLEQEFRQELSKNEDFQKENQEMQQQGYKPVSDSLDPKTNNTGDFEINYQKDNGETANIKGSMNNSKIENMQKTTSQDTKNMLQKLYNNSQFKRYDSELKNQGFAPKPPEIEQQDNTTDINIQYTNEKNETASISAKIEKEEVKKVILEKDKKDNLWLWAIPLLAIIALTLFFIYKKRKKQPEEIKEIKPEKPFNYKKEAKRLLEESKQLFQDKKEKNAYGKAGEAIRLYFSYKLNLKKEITNYEVIKELKKNKLAVEDTQKCLNLCAMVEFAKYKANKKDFDEIIKLAGSIIG